MTKPELMTTLAPERQQELREVQRAWIKYRDANCKFYDVPDEEAFERFLATSCSTFATASRAQELLAFLNR